MGKSTIKWQFSIAMLNYQRVMRILETSVFYSRTTILYCLWFVQSIFSLVAPV